MKIRKTKQSTQCSDTTESTDAGATKLGAQEQTHLESAKDQTSDVVVSAQEFLLRILDLPYITATAREAIEHSVPTHMDFIAHIYGLPHADTFRGERAGVEWACKVGKILGPRFQQKMREVMKDVHVDSKNISFLATIHSGCFGRVLDADYPKVHMAEYMRGFLIGVRKNQEEANAGA